MVQFEIKALVIVRSESQTEPPTWFDARLFQGRAMSDGDVESDIAGFCVMIKRGGRERARRRRDRIGKRCLQENFAFFRGATNS